MEKFSFSRPEKIPEKDQLLQEIIRKRYQSPDSTVAGDKELIEQLIRHVEQVAQMTEELALEKNLPARDREILKLASYLHDLAKADQPPKGKESIFNYVLAAHGEMAADQIPEILKRHPRLLEGFSRDERESPKEREEIIRLIQDIVRSHMGPHPGFMRSILASVNARLPLRERISHPQPSDILGETLLAADMFSLASAEGRKKVLKLRESSENFRSTDEKIRQEYARCGIDLSLGEAALLSGHESALDACLSINESDYRSKLEKALEYSTKETGYIYDGSPIDYSLALEKKTLYLEMIQRELKPAEEKIAA